MRVPFTVTLTQIWYSEIGGPDIVVRNAVPYDKPADPEKYVASLLRRSMYGLTVHTNPNPETLPW